MSDTESAPVRILILCTHNSARSQVAEALLRQMGGARVEAFSAGSEPSRVHPDALALLERKGIDGSQLTSKHLAQYIDQPFDYVITVCDHAQEVCPVFPGAKNRLHWSFPDPSAQQDPAARAQVFEEVYAGLQERFATLLATIPDEQQFESQAS